MLRRATRIISGLLLVFGLTLPALGQEVPPGGTFVDDDGDFHEGAIEAIVDQGITEGCSLVRADYYCPDETTTRAQMAAFLLRGIGHGGHLPPYEGYFSDVPQGAWFTPYVEHLSEHGITEGCRENHFCPGEPVQRGEMAAFILRAIDHDGHLPDYQGYFTDVARDAWFRPYVEHLYEHGITEGCTWDESAYCPGESVTRGQMATFLARALDLQTHHPPLRTARGCITSDQHDPTGDLSVVPGEGKATGPDPVLTYRVETEEGLSVDGECFATNVEGILFDDRGWSRGNQEFMRTDREDPEARIILASPETTDRLCQPLDTEGQYSCRVGEKVVLNFDRWRFGAEDFARMAIYRAYQINHEVGHRIGEDHWNQCPQPDGPAPVMMQQTIEVYGSCEPNPWPLGAEVD